MSSVQRSGYNVVHCIVLFRNIMVCTEQCSAGQFSVVQCRAVQCRTVQSSAMQCNVVECSALQ